MGLVEAFVQQLPESRRASVAAHPELESRVEELFARGRQAEPSIALDGALFAAFAAERVAESDDPLGTLETLHAEDLYLACACAAGIPAAWRSFRARHAPAIEAALRSRARASVSEELLQEILAHLMQRDARGRARIGQYAGRGKLRSWVKVAAIRFANRAMVKERRHEPVQDDALFDRLTAAGDPDLEYVRGLYRAELKASFAEAFAELDSRERNILRYELLEGLTLEDIGAVYGVNRSTVCRWRQKAHRTLYDSARRIVRERLHIDEGELESVVRLLGSQLELSVARILREHSTEASD